MKIGVCAPPRFWAAAKELGYDHVEWNFSVIAGYTEEQMAQYLAQKKELGLEIPSCNGFFPGGFMMFGEDRAQIEDAKSSSPPQRRNSYTAFGVLFKNEKPNAHAFSFSDIIYCNSTSTVQMAYGAHVPTTAFSLTVAAASLFSCTSA